MLKFIRMAKENNIKLNVTLHNKNFFFKPRVISGIPTTVGFFGMLLNNKKDVIYWGEIKRIDIADDQPNLVKLIWIS